MGNTERQPARLTRDACVSARTALCVVVAAVAGVSNVFAQNNAAQPTSPAAAFDAAYGEWRKGDYENSRKRFEAILEDGTFERLDSPRQHGTLVSLAILALRDRAPERAYTYALRATSLPGAGAYDWMTRLSASSSTQKWDDAIVSLTTIAKQWPESLEPMDFRYVYQLVRIAGVEPRRKPAYFELLRTLFDARWQPKVLGQPSSLWFSLARMHLDRGDRAAAAAVIERVTAPMDIVRMRGDKRFDALREAHPARFDLAAAIEAELVQARNEIARAPDALQPVNLLAGRLIYAGRCEEALAVVDAAIARAASHTAESKPYVDGGAEFPWLLDTRAQALHGLGRFDDSVRQRVEVSMLEERGEQNVSQMINLAGLYAELHRPADALKALRQVGTPNDFGRMQREGVRLAAAVQLQDQAMVKEALDYLRSHRMEALGTLQSALVTAGAMEEAADLLVERLANVDWRADALLTLQDYAPGPETPSSRERRARWDQLKSLPRVKAAVERVGRIERYPLPE